MKILIVDPTELLPRLFKGMVQDLTIDFTVLQTGAEAKQLVDREKFDFIILSLFLNDDIDGIACAKYIRQKINHEITPIFLLATTVTPELIKKSSMVNITDVFDKGRELPQLVTLVRRYLSCRQPLEGNVLLIEDSLAQRSFLLGLLRSYGLSVDGYESAEEAVLAMEGKDYDLILTDIVLSGTMSGTKLVSYVRRIDSYRGDIPILAITAFDSVTRRIELFFLGVDDYVIKPVIEEELMARVRNLLIKGKLRDKK